MLKYCIHSSALGSDKNFLRSDEGFSWSPARPLGAWTLSAVPLKGSRPLSEVLALGGVHLPQIPDNHVAAMRHLVTGSHASIPWQHVLPRRVYENYFKNTVKVIEDAFSELPFDYHEVAWAPCSELLSCLKPARVDSDSWSNLLEGSAVNAPVLASFKPDARGFAEVPTYNRFGTRTGRLTVASGPNILTLKREHRTIIKSSFKSGAVLSLDFRALEPRIVLAEAGRCTEADDIYGEIAEKIFGDRQNRDAVKVAIISELYGAAKESLRARLGITQKKIDAFVKGIGEYFSLDSLRQRLETEAQSGKIKNRYGRPLVVDPTAKNLFVNTYVQSTGVDVALLGFKSVVDKLGTDGVRPLYVLHDALILDVRHDRLRDVEQISSVTVPGYDVSFPLKLDKI